MKIKSFFSAQFMCAEILIAMLVIGCKNDENPDPETNFATMSVLNYHTQEPMPGTKVNLYNCPPPGYSICASHEPIATVYTDAAGLFQVDLIAVDWVFPVMDDYMVPRKWGYSTFEPEQPFLYHQSWAKILLIDDSTITNNFNYYRLYFALPNDTYNNYHGIDSYVPYQDTIFYLPVLGDVVSDVSYTLSDNTNGQIAIDKQFTIQPAWKDTIELMFKF